jgi:hypothetical protein
MNKSFKPKRKSQQEITEQVKGLLAEGKTNDEISDILGRDYGYAIKYILWAKRISIDDIRKNSANRDQFIFDTLKPWLKESPPPSLTEMTARLKAKDIDTHRTRLSKILQARGVIEKRRGSSIHIVQPEDKPAGKPETEKKWPKQMKCLGTDCGKWFTSEGPGNRMCPNCRSRTW